MSLDVYLLDESGETLFSANITHNLGPMASAAGVYDACWYPEEGSFGYAGQLIKTLEAGLIKMVLAPSTYKQHNAPNGWGKWEHFVPWLAEYLEACKAYPDARIRVSR